MLLSASLYLGDVGQLARVSSYVEVMVFRFLSSTLELSPSLISLLIGYTFFLGIRCVSSYLTRTAGTFPQSWVKGCGDSGVLLKAVSLMSVL